MRLRSVAPAVTAFSVLAAASVPVSAQIGTIDEGAFTIARHGAPVETESFKIARIDNGLIQATGQLAAGDDRVSSSLVVDSTGTPVSYLYLEKTRGATVLTIRALSGARRLSLSSSDNQSNESMKDFPLGSGRTLILDDGLVHQLYFVARTEHPGEIHLIRPRNDRREIGMLTGKGLEPLEIGGRSVTATHYSLVNGSMTRDFWVDARGRLLRVEIPSLGLIATREELPQ